jgi:putative transposase
VHRALRKQGVGCGKRRVRRLMREAGLEGRCKKRWRTTTVADPDAEVALDLIRRHFGPGVEVDRRHVGDITYIATWEGWAYLATVIDLSSRRVVGWALADHMRTELVADALTMAFRDNAVAESFFATIKRELVDTRAWPTRAGLHRAVFDYIEGWYNVRRLHSSLDCCSPAEWETIHRNADRQAA